MAGAPTPDQDLRQGLHRLGFTRSVVARRHALITPDAHIRAPLPGWRESAGIVLISPRMGAGFSQYLVEMGAGGEATPPPPGVERFIYVLEGQVQLDAGDLAGSGPVAAGLAAAGRTRLGPGGYAFVPPIRTGAGVYLKTESGCRLNVFEKVFAALPGQEPPPTVAGNVAAVAAAPYLGDPAARLQVLLPDTPAFDLAVNVFAFAPGAAHPFVEVHVMEHGLLMLQGGGIYRLDRDWYPVQSGDAIWMGPYCAQWFCAVGKEPARYLYCKDVNRDPMGGGDHALCPQRAGD